MLSVSPYFLYYQFMALAPLYLYNRFAIRTYCYVEIISEKVERVLDRFTRADIVIADPPRAGLGARVCAMIDDLNPRVIVYVSCDPSSLARDARLLVDAGYEMDLIRAFDLFPMTHHIECVARFIKSA